MKDRRTWAEAEREGQRLFRVGDKKVSCRVAPAGNCVVFNIYNSGCVYKYDSINGWAFQCETCFFRIYRVCALRLAVFRSNSSRFCRNSVYGFIDGFGSGMIN